MAQLHEFLETVFHARLVNGQRVTDRSVPGGGLFYTVTFAGTILKGNKAPRERGNSYVHPSLRGEPWNSPFYFYTMGVNPSAY